MRAEQLAFWKKLQYHHQVFVEKDLTSCSIKIAYNSSTKNEETLASHSIHSKFYSTDEKVIHPIYAVVVKMIEDIIPTLTLLEKMKADLELFMH